MNVNQQQQCFEHKKNKLSPSKLRRRERRAAAAQSSSVTDKAKVCSSVVPEDVMKALDDGVNCSCEAFCNGCTLGADKAPEDGNAGKALAEGLGTGTALDVNHCAGIAYEDSHGLSKDLDKSGDAVEAPDDDTSCIDEND